jgi:hypothetical protein
MGKGCLESGKLLILLVDFSCATFTFWIGRTTVPAGKHQIDRTAQQSRKSKIMAHLDIRQILKRALERLKDSERVKDDDPSLEHLKSQVVRSVAELEVEHMRRVRAEDEEPPKSAAA